MGRTGTHGDPRNHDLAAAAAGPRVAMKAGDRQDRRSPRQPSARADAGAGSGGSRCASSLRHLGIGAARPIVTRSRTRTSCVDRMVDHVKARRRSRRRRRPDSGAPIAAIACRTRGILLRHPWMITVTAFPDIARPNNLRWLERTLRSVDRTAASTPTRLLVIANTLLIFVEGAYVMLRAQEAGGDARYPASPAASNGCGVLQAPYGKVIEDSGEYPVFCRMMDEAKAPHAPDLVERAFATGPTTCWTGLPPCCRDSGAGAATRTMIRFAAQASSSG